MQKKLTKSKRLRYCIYVWSGELKQNRRGCVIVSIYCPESWVLRCCAPARWCGEAGLAHTHTRTIDIFKVFLVVEVFFERKWAFRSQSLLRFFMHMKIHFSTIFFYLNLQINNFFKKATLMYVSIYLHMYISLAILKKFFICKLR